MAIPETFRVNPRTPGQPDRLDVVPPGGAIPAQTFIVPRRNNGPLLSLDMASGTALSVQYAGFSPTTELESFRRFNLARNVDDFRAAMQYFDLGGQHFIYADVQGNIAYFTNAEVPVREDLQAGAVRGNPPYLLRDGTGGNEWLPVTNPQPNQSVPYEILPQRELPQVVNPPAGFIVSANNDPTGNTFDNDVLNQVRPGGGIFYLGFAHNAFRAGRITDMVRAAVRKGRVTPADVIDMQADVTSLDAQFFTPLITGALDRARRSSTPELVALAKDAADRRGGRPARAVAADVPDRHPGGVRREPTAAAGSAHRPGGRSRRAWPPRSTRCGAGRFLVNVIDRHVQADLAAAPGVR